MRNRSKFSFAAWLIILIFALLQLVINTSVKTDIISFMPAGNDAQQRQLLQALNQGAASRLWILAITEKTSNSEDKKEKKNRADSVISQSMRLAVRLRESGLFSSVLNGAVELDDESSQQLFRYRYLLDPELNEKSFTVAMLRYSLLQGLDGLASPFSSFSKERLLSDPTLAMQRVSAQMQKGQSGQAKIDSEKGIWYSRTHKQALLIANSRATGDDLDEQEKAYKRILNEFEHVMQPNVDLTSQTELTVSGVPYFAVSTRESIRSESKRLSTIASLFMLAFMYFVFRSVPVVLLSIVPLMAGVMVAAAGVSFVYGSIHGITLAFGITLLGVAIDYPVHLFCHAKKSEPLQQTAKKIWPVLRLGVLTSALAYAAMAWSNFNGLSQLGMFSLLGLVTAALATKTLLPLFTYQFFNSHLNGRSIKLPTKIRLFMATNRLKLAAVLIPGLILIGIFGGPSFKSEKIWSEDISDLSPVSSKLIKQNAVLRQRLALPESSDMIRIQANHVEQLLRKEEQLKPILDEAIKNKFISSYSLAANIISSIYLQKQRQESLPDRETLAARLSIAVEGLPYRVESFSGFLDAVSLSKHLSLLRPEDLGQGLLSFALAGLLNSKHKSDQASASAYVSLSNVEDKEGLQVLLAASGIAQMSLVNLKDVSNGMVNAFRDEMVSRMSWVAVVMVLVLIVALKKIKNSLRVIFPVVLAVLFAAWVPLSLGQSLNLFHLVSLLLVAGLGLDYALFFNSIDVKSGNVNSVVSSLIICSVSSFSVFSILAFSGIPVLNAIGTTVASGVFAAILFSGWFFVHRIDKAISD